MTFRLSPGRASILVIFPMNCSAGFVLGPRTRTASPRLYLCLLNTNAVKLLYGGSLPADAGDVPASLASLLAMVSCWQILG